MSITFSLNDHSRRLEDYLLRLNTDGEYWERVISLIFVPFGL